MNTTADPLNPFVVRQMTLDDVSSVIELMERAFPGKPPWGSELMARHLEIFPEGQFVAVDGTGCIVGSSSSLIIDWDDYAESANWAVITGKGTFDTHNPLGLTLYGAEIGVDALARKQGIGTLLYEARKDLIRERGLKRLLTGGRIAGYADVAEQVTPKEYVAEVIDGKRWDPALSFQLENGLVVLDVVPGFRHRAGMAEPRVFFLSEPAGRPALRGPRTSRRRGHARHSTPAPRAHRRRPIPAPPHRQL
jgi:ribosomal protein S18 acetylase RimI-like enzyme